MNAWASIRTFASAYEGLWNVSESMRPAMAAALVALLPFLAGCSVPQVPAGESSDAPDTPAGTAAASTHLFDGYYEPPAAGALGPEEVLLEENITIAPQDERLWGFNITEDAAVVRYEADIVGQGSKILAIVHPVEKASLERANHNGWAQAEGLETEGSVWLVPGWYALGVTCRSAEPCDVRARIVVQAASTVVHESGCVSAPALDEFPAGGVVDWRPRDAQPIRSSFLVVESPETHYVGKGGTGNYSSDMTEVAMKAEGAHLRAVVSGWMLEVTLPEMCPRFERGFYPNLLQDVVRDGALGGIGISRAGRACGGHHGHVVVDEARYDEAGQLMELWLRLAHHCESERAPPLLAQLHWTSTPSIPACGEGPNDPAEGLLLPGWDVPEGSVDFSPYLFVRGSAGGPNATYSVEDDLAVTAEGGMIRVSTSAGRNEFHLPYYCGRVVPGLYAPALLLLHLGTSGCYEPLASALAVDDVHYDDAGALRALTLRYEQVCPTNQGDGRRIGKLVWDADASPSRPRDCVHQDAFEDTGEARSLPSWRPSVEIPAERNFAYFSSVPGDRLGDGKDQVFEGTRTVSARFGRGFVDLAMGDFSGTLRLPGDCPRPAVGQFEVRCATPQDPLFACFKLEGSTSTCPARESRVVIDEALQTADGSIDRLVLRFEQRCEGGPAFLGFVSWTAPPPAGSACGQPLDAPGATTLASWQPEDEPTTGSYALVEPEDGGTRETFTSFLNAYTYSTSSLIHVGKPDMSFGLDLDPGSTCGRLEAGYYAAPPASVSVDAGPACTSDVGEFIIDEVTYVEDRVKTLTARFRQECTGEGETVLRGKVHIEE